MAAAMTRIRLLASRLRTGHHHRHDIGHHQFGESYATGVNCAVPGTSSCLPAAMAAYDLQNWQTALNAELPPTATSPPSAA